ncbi:hypothetical protein GW916_03870 [bacterium]|nr:hypothetical protein [bacterium]
MILNKIFTSAEKLTSRIWVKGLVLSVFLLNSNQSFATILSDLHLGTLRPALQDSIFDEDSDDPFRVIGNPAWATNSSVVALGVTGVGADMNGKAANEDNNYLISFMYQERKGRWGFGAFTVFPSGSQPILDTGSELERASPWMNMTRQISYAANLSRHWERWSLGVLLPVYFNATADVRANLATADVNTRAKLYLKPAVSYGVGGLYRLDKSSTLSITYKEKASAQTTAIFESNIPILSLDLVFEGESSYAFDPRRIAVSYSRDTGFGLWGARLRYSQWSKFSTPYIELTNSSLNIVDASPDGSAKDAWDATVAVLWKSSPDTKWAFSIGYQESPFSQISTYYDSDQVKAAVAYSRKFAGDWSLSSHVRFHLLNRGVYYLMGGLGVAYSI